jgi:Ala-tRNA(Pro) deacylase
VIGGPVQPDEDTYERLVTLLDNHQARYRFIDHRPEGATVAASRLRGHPLGQAAKSIVVRVTVTKKRSEYALAVVPGDTKVNLDRVRGLLGGVRVGFAQAETAERLAGSVTGTVIPFSFDPKLALVVDPGLLAHEEIFFNAARLDRSIGLHTHDYLALSRPRVAAIAHRELPKEPT